jgi:hypothetical protein
VSSNHPTPVIHKADGLSAPRLAASCVRAINALFRRHDDFDLSLLGDIGRPGNGGYLYVEALTEGAKVVVAFRDDVRVVVRDLRAYSIDTHAFRVLDAGEIVLSIPERVARIVAKDEHVTIESAWRTETVARATLDHGLLGLHWLGHVDVREASERDWDAYLAAARLALLDFNEPADRTLTIERVDLAGTTLLVGFRWRKTGTHSEMRWVLDTLAPDDDAVTFGLRVRDQLTDTRPRQFTDDVR